MDGPESLCFLLFWLFALVASLEALYSSGCVDDTVFAREQGMALAADFRSDQLLGSAGDKAVAASTCHLGIGIVGRMYLFLHFSVSTE
jgi:hypothetical protein